METIPTDVGEERVKQWYFKGGVGRGFNAQLNGGVGRGLNAHSLNAIPMWEPISWVQFKDITICKLIWIYVFIM